MLYYEYMKRSDDGFTIVEITITLVIAALFIILLTQGYTNSVAQQQSAERYAVMSNIAHINLTKYLSLASLKNNIGTEYTTTPCSHTDLNSSFVLLNNEPAKRESIPAGNYGNVEQKVVVYSPHGCSNSPTVTSIVVYGQENSRETISRSAKIR